MVLYSAAPRRLASTLNVNRNLQEECIDEGIYRAQGIPFTANAQTEGSSRLFGAILSYLLFDAIFEQWTQGPPKRQF